MSDSESFQYQVIMRFITGKLYAEEAALMLNCSKRTISRLAKRVREKGMMGVKHGNYAKNSNRKTDPELKEMVLDLKQNEYFDYNCQHFYDILVSKYKFKQSYHTVWRWLKSTNMVKHSRRKRRKKHTYRPRLPQEGLMLQMDGSHHQFNGRDDWVLVSCIDDATSEIPYAEFFHGETTLACMKVLKRIIEIKGVPQMIYTDKAGWSGGGTNDLPKPLP